MPSASAPDRRLDEEPGDCRSSTASAMPPTRVADHGLARRRRLERHAAEGLGPHRRLHDHVGEGVERPHLGVRAAAEDVHRARASPARPAPAAAKQTPGKRATKDAGRLDEDGEALAQRPLPRVQHEQAVRQAERGEPRAALGGCDRRRRAVHGGGRL